MSSGEEEQNNAQTSAAAPSTTATAAPRIPAPQPAYNDNAEVERATDPRRPPAPAVKEETHDEVDPDREFARNGGGHWQSQQSGSRDDSPQRDNRPNPNKHEDG